MDMHTIESSTDLRLIAFQRWGHPLAASRHASLWRCPCCERRSHALMMVTTDQFRCLGRCGMSGGSVEMNQMLGVTDVVAPMLEMIEVIE
jgi:hypothetical protein